MIGEKSNFRKASVSPARGLRDRERARHLGVQHQQLEIRAGGILAMFYREQPMGAENSLWLRQMITQLRAGVNENQSTFV
jgi:hypothetical protein